MRAVFLIGVFLLAGAACGSESGSEASSESVTTEPAAAAEPGTSLQITFWSAGQDSGAQPEMVTLTCDPAGGTHPHPDEACAKLATIDDPFAPPPSDEMCTQQYGGDEQALIEGTYQGQPVHYPLSQGNGCEIARFEQFRFLLPGGGRA